MKRLILSICLLTSFFSCKKEIVPLSNTNDEKQMSKAGLFVIDKMELNFTQAEEIYKKNYVLIYDSNQRLSKIQTSKNDEFYSETDLLYNLQNKIELLEQKRNNQPVGDNDKRYFFYDGNGNLESIKQTPSSTDEYTFFDFKYRNNKFIAYDRPLEHYFGENDFKIKRINYGSNNNVSSVKYRFIYSNLEENIDTIKFDFTYFYTYLTNVKNPFKNLNLPFNSPECLDLLFNLNTYFEGSEDNYFFFTSWLFYPQNSLIPTHQIVVSDGKPNESHKRTVKVLQQTNGYPTLLTISQPDNLYFEPDTIKFTYKTIY